MKIRTPESIREDAAKQFAWGIDFAFRLERDVAEPRADEELGMRLVDAALALPEGELFDWGAHLPADMPAEDKFHRGFRVLPFLAGPLHLLVMEFAHATAGVVSHDAVRALLAGAETVEFQGVELTAKTVVMQYRRKPLN
jgi:hypothetical protein